MLGSICFQLTSRSSVCGAAGACAASGTAAAARVASVNTTTVFTTSILSERRRKASRDERQYQPRNRDGCDSLAAAHLGANRRARSEQENLPETEEVDRLEKPMQEFAGLLGNQKCQI